ncbi:VOC family protein [Amycolatopsis thermoflava]|uniref:VOC family protein n=1 Tax=Amycolatopsis thermoflava TaxID=84480 RepID=UPI00364737DE
MGLTGAEISEAVRDAGWRYVLAGLSTAVSVPSARDAGVVAQRVLSVADEVAVDIRPGRVRLALAPVTAREIDLARRISELVRDLGYEPSPADAQVLEIAIDTLDAARIVPFWRAVMDYVDGPRPPEVVDPRGQGPSIWFQQMDAPRPQRNRMHIDVSVPHDEAPRRIEAALAAGGVLRSDEAAPAFWVLADAEGNEACVTTWQGRD